MKIDNVIIGSSGLVGTVIYSKGKQGKTKHKVVLGHVRKIFNIMQDNYY